MRTEVDIAEYSIRARLKLGDLADEISDRGRYGEPVDDLVDQATFIRLFLNALNSPYQKWSLDKLYKRTEYLARKYELVQRPKYSKDWLNQFDAPIQAYKESTGSIDIPAGTGFLYSTDGVLSIVSTTQFTIDDLPTTV